MVHIRRYSSVNACTIIAKNYLAHARVLAESFAEHHPDGRFFVLVIDEIDGYIDPDAESFEIVFPDQIGLEAWDEMRGAYDVLELSTAVKPWLLRWLLHEHDDGSGTAYLDPDIRVLSRMVELEESLQQHSACLDAPCDPGDASRRKEAERSRHPVGGRLQPRVHRAVEQRARAQASGLVVGAAAHRLPRRPGTRRCSLTNDGSISCPGWSAELDIFRDPTYNVAYWNLPERPLTGARTMTSGPGTARCASTTSAAIAPTRGRRSPATRTGRVWWMTRSSQSSASPTPTRSRPRASVTCVSTHTITTSFRVAHS